MLLAAPLLGCGFEPVHRAGGTPLVAKIETATSQNGRLVARALGQRLGRAADAPFDLSARLSETASDAQLDTQGVAQRRDIVFALQLIVTDRSNGRQVRQRFTDRQSMTRSESGADDMVRRQSLRRLAVERLAAQAAGFMRRLKPAGDAPDTKKPGTKKPDTNKPVGENIR